MSDSNYIPIPDRIGEYTPTERIGEGGFGVVYAATAPDGTEVAIKVLRPELSNNAEVRERLRREATASQAITSDRVARVLGHDTEADRPYIVMERIQGATLTDYVGERGPLAGAMLSSVAMANEEALRDIHASGILHRDLKPSNVMLGPDGIKILDFGIAAINEAADFTQTGAVLGSASWMSPEQITGTSVDASSDVFAMGLVLAFAALGRHPYGEGRPEALMYRIDQGQPDLDAITGPSRRHKVAMLRRDPKERPSVANVIELLSGSNSNSDLLSPTPPAEPNTPTPRADATRVIPSYPSPKQPEPVEPRRRRRRRRRKVVLALLASAAIGGAFAIAAVNLDPIGQGEPMTSSGAEAALAADEENTPEVEPSPEVEISTSTVPAIPIYKLAERFGKPFRWAPCGSPISIRVNNSDRSLSDDEIAAVARFLTNAAAEVSEITGHIVFYGGLSDRTTQDSAREGEILIQISEGGDGLLDEGTAGTSRPKIPYTDGSSAIITNYRIHLHSDNISSAETGDLADRSKNALLYFLGKAFGLERLERDDFVAFGISDEAAMMNERMHWPSVNDPRSSNAGEWGPGDMVGMYLAQVASCY